MLEFLINLDKDIFLFLNSFHSSFWDVVMYQISGKIIWAPLYLTVAVFIFIKYKLRVGIVIVIFFGLIIAVADLSSVHLFKNVFERLRPCHNPDIQNYVHIVKRCGGQYGFVSSHAANSFAFAVFSLLILKNKFYSFGIIFWATIVAYSRVYLGVHYTADILGGAILGGTISILFFKFYAYIIKKIIK